MKNETLKTKTLKTEMKTTTTDAAPAAPPTDEPRNVAVHVINNRTQIGKAICAAGKCDFPLTATEAKALEALGLVTITGIWA